MIKLTAKNVQEIIFKCLFEPTEKTDNAVIAEGVFLRIGFNPDRLTENKAAITEMISQLPASFMEDTGGGSSFLNAVIDNAGHQWADAHSTIDELLCLGLAIGKIEYNAPRQLWRAFPAGMPYFFVKK